MSKLLKLYIGIVTLALLVATWLPALVQTVRAEDALVVNVCGTLPLAYSPGSTRQPTVDINGKLCGNTSSIPPLPLPTAGITPYISPSLESCKSLKTTPGTVVSYGVTTGATAGFLMIFDQSSATPPVDGAVTPAALAIQVPANATVTRTYSPPSTLKMLNGIMLCFSSTGPYTKTASATAMLEGTWQ